MYADPKLAQISFVIASIFLSPQNSMKFKSKQESFSQLHLNKFIVQAKAIEILNKLSVIN